MTAAGRPDRRTPRDQLTGTYRALSDVLDDWLWREHQLITSHNGWDLFLDLLDEHGVEVRAAAPEEDGSVTDYAASAISAWFRRIDTVEREPGKHRTWITGRDGHGDTYRLHDGELADRIAETATSRALEGGLSQKAVWEK